MCVNSAACGTQRGGAITTRTMDGPHKMVVKVPQQQERRNKNSGPSGCHTERWNPTEDMVEVF